MKSNVLIMGLVVTFTLIAGIGVAGAGTTMRISVPFDFYAGDQHLRAGDYIFEMGSGFLHLPSVVTLRTKEGTGQCILLTQTGTDTDAARLLFNKYGDKHFLSGVSIQGIKANVQMTKIEKELRAQIERERDTVILAQR